MLLKFDWRVLLEELIDREITSANSDFDIVLLDLDSAPLRAELVDTFRLAHKHNLQLVAIRIVVDVLG